MLDKFAAAIRLTYHLMLIIRGMESLKRRCSWHDSSDVLV